MTAPPSFSDRCEIPKKYLRDRKVRHWAKDYRVRPALVSEHLGDGKLLLGFQCLNTRPNYYLIRVDSNFYGEPDSETVYDNIEVVIEAIEEQYGEKEREREYLAEDLRSQGIEPTTANTDLAGNEDRLDWPVLSLDSGYHWWIEAILGGKP